MKGTFTLVLALLLTVVLGIPKVGTSSIVADQSEPSPLVGASYMTFWGTGMNEDWPTGSVYTPILGNYSSDNASIAAQHIENASQRGIKFFFLDYGWGNDTEKTLMENAAINGIINASETAGNFSFCIFYFPDDGISGKAINKTGLEKDFQHINETYFKYSSYLRLNGSKVVILADFPKYLETTTPASEINDEFWNLTEKYELYLVPALWPDWNYDMQCAVLNDSKTRTPPVYSAITLWGGTTIIYWNKTISYSEYFNKTKENFQTWNCTAANYSVGFVPLICPGYSNLIYAYTNALARENDTWWAIVTRNPQVWNDTYQLAYNYTSHSSHPMILLFTWNDFKEGTSIEPTEDYGSTYLDAIPEFPSTILLPLFMVATLLAVMLYKSEHSRQRAH